MSNQESVNTFASVSRRSSAARHRRGRLASRLLGAAAAYSAVLLGGLEYAHAGEYTVYTTDEAVRSSMSLNANDGYCSLAEAVASANAGVSKYNCADSDPGTFQTIKLVEASGKSFANYPYKITTLTINSPNRSVMLTSVGNSRGKINVNDLSNTYSGFVIKSGTQMTFNFVDLTYTGTAGKRLVENLGGMDAYAAIFSNGNVTTHQQGRGGAIYNAGLIFHLGSDVEIRGNKAKRGGGIFNDKGTMHNVYAKISANTASAAGGGIYNDDGTINSLYGTISGNTAGTAGGGVYNMSTAVDAGGPSKGRIFGGATITGNSARAGGGVFNRGEFDMTGGQINSNTVSGTGSGETCGANQSCDGAGGGIVSVPGSATLIAILRTRSGTRIFNNTATGFGGGVYTAGIANLLGITFSDNKAKSGAGLYAVPQGASYYCEVGNPATEAASTFVNNSVTTAGTDRYSILDGIALDANPTRQCLIRNTAGLLNTSPRCNPNMLRSGGACPQ